MTAWDAMTVATVASSDQRQRGPGRGEEEERVGHGARVTEDHRALPEVVDGERREDDAGTTPRRMGLAPKWPMSA